MALVPHSSGVTLHAHRMVEKLGQFFAGAAHPGFSPEEAMRTGPAADPRLIPRTAMSSDNIDIGTLGELSKIGMRRGKLITAESHPELMAEWESLARTAGVQPTPQLILAESDTLNALTFNRQEMAITTGLMKLLDLREVRAVLAHELGHAQSDHLTPRITMGAALGGAGVLIGNAIGRHVNIGRHVSNFVSQWAPMGRLLDRLFGESRHTTNRPTSALGYLAYISAGATIGGIIASQMTVRPTELDADAKGAAISGDPLALASALAKLEGTRPVKGISRFIGQVISGYPSTEDRIARLQRMAAEQPHGPGLVPQPPVLPQAPAPTVEAAPMLSLSEVGSSERMVGTSVEPQRSA